MNVDVDSRMFTLAVLRKSQRLRLGLSSDRRHPSVAHPAGGLWWLLCLIGPCTIRTENMGIIDVLWQGQEGCLLDLSKKDAGV